MKVAVSLNGAGPMIRALDGAEAKIHRGWKQGAYAVGQRAVTLIQREYRTGGTDAKRTAVRSGKLRASYAHEVADTHNGVDLAIGAIKPTEKGAVPLHARVHEGFDARGNRVSRFVIEPKRGKYLTFPIRQGGGLAKTGIVGWVRVKRVILKPRPAIEPVGKDVPAALKVVCGKVFTETLTVRA